MPPSARAVRAVGSTYTLFMGDTSIMRPSSHTALPATSALFREIIGPTLDAAANGSVSIWKRMGSPPSVKVDNTSHRFHNEAGTILAFKQKTFIGSYRRPQAETRSPYAPHDPRPP